MAKKGKHKTSNILTNSIKPLKMVHIKKRIFFKKRKGGLAQDLSYGSWWSWDLKPVFGSRTHTKLDCFQALLHCIQSIYRQMLLESSLLNTKHLLDTHGDLVQLLETPPVFRREEKNEGTEERMQRVGGLGNTS